MKPVQDFSPQTPSSAHFLLRGSIAEKEQENTLNQSNVCLLVINSMFLFLTFSYSNKYDVCYDVK